MTGARLGRCFWTRPSALSIQLSRFSQQSPYQKSYCKKTMERTAMHRLAQHARRLHSAIRPSRVSFTYIKEREYGVASVLRCSPFSIARGFGYSSQASFGVEANHQDAHTYDESQDEQLELEENELKNNVLRHALAHVHTAGWTVEAITSVVVPAPLHHHDTKLIYRQGALDCGLTVTSHGLFPEGELALVEYFVNDCNRQLVEMYQDKDWDRTRHIDRLYDVTMARLKLLQPLIGNWHQAAAILSLPQNLPTSLHLGAVTVDEIWHLVGDNSSDTSWYSKRAMLLCVYVSTELFMMTDTSDEYQETWGFLKRRIDDIYDTEKILREAPNTSITTVIAALASLPFVPNLYPAGTEGAPTTKGESATDENGATASAGVEVKA